MKKTLLFLAFVALFISCKPNQATTIDHKAQVEIKGNWILTKVSYVGMEYFKVNAFQIADSKCFEGSTWRFISNNNKGQMALTKGNCPSFSSDFVWSINQEGRFGLKIVAAGEKARKITEGYFLTIIHQSETSFQLIDKMDIGGKMSDVTYQFEKNN